MRILRIFILATLSAVVSATAFAGHYSDLYVIPVASHTPGVNATMWMSDVAIHNFQPVPLTVQLIVIEAGTSPDNVMPVMTPLVDGAVTVPANGNVMLKDLLAGHRGMQSTIGALLVGADQPFAVTSRSYSMSPTGDTVGQTVTPAADFLTFSPINLASAVAYIPGLVQNDEFRTNLGMVAANGSGSGAAMVIEVAIRDEAGAVVGTRGFAIAPGEVMQMQMSARAIAAANFDVGSADFRITSGDGSVVPYASIIDNRTADAVYVSGTFPQKTTDAAMAKPVGTSAFRVLFDSMRKDWRKERIER